MLRVTCLILIHKGKVMAAQREMNTSNGGKWEFPGGKVKQDESDRNCIIREIKEELGIQVTPLTQLPTFNGFEIQLIPFVANGFSGDISLKVHRNIKFVFPNQLKLLDWSEADQALARYLEEKWDQLMGKDVAEL